MVLMEMYCKIWKSESKVILYLLLLIPIITAIVYVFVICMVFGIGAMILSKGILNRKDLRTLDDKTWSLIQYRLSLWELIQTFLIPIHMTSYLEELLCGYIPERHTVIEPFVGYVGE